MVSMAPWASCSLEEEILSILEADSPVTIRYLCSLLFPDQPWLTAERYAAESIRAHCHLLARQRLVRETSVDLFSLAEINRA